jgi:hypothetical protein
MVNEQLEAFRRRLRNPETPQQTPERMKGKDWVAILISIIALALSAMTAYFSFVRQTEELRVFVGEFMPFLTRADDGRLHLEGYLDITFMNTGTQPIVVLGAELAIKDISERKDEESKSCKQIFGNLPFDVDPFVVKEKESISKLLRLRVNPRLSIEAAQLIEDGRIVVPAPKNARGEPSQFVKTCVRLIGATPSRQPLFADIALLNFQWSDQAPAATVHLAAIGRYFQFTTPIVTWTKRGPFSM